jgi:DNA-binding NarL/FixJ family response regulator
MALPHRVAKMHEATTIKLLVVDDHIVLREGLVRVLRGARDVEIVGETGNGLGAVELARRLRPDVVLMDLYLPGIDGAAATRVIARDLPEVK